MQLTAHFDLKEFVCRHCKKFPNDNKTLSGLLFLCEELEKVRSVLGLPINVSSGYRCPEYNNYVGGAVDSFHLKGLAADIIIAKPIKEDVSRLLTGPELLRLVVKSRAQFNGIGVGDSYIHLDIGNRESPTIWFYQDVLKNPEDSTILKKSTWRRYFRNF